MLHTTHLSWIWKWQLCHVAAARYRLSTLYFEGDFRCWKVLLYFHLVNLTFVLLTDPSFILQLQYAAPRPHLIHTFFSVSTFPPVLFSLYTFTILLSQRAQQHNVLGACKASGFQAHASSRPIHSLLQCQYTKSTRDCLLDLSNTNYWPFAVWAPLQF